LNNTGWWQCLYNSCLVLCVLSFFFLFFAIPTAAVLLSKTPLLLEQFFHFLVLVMPSFRVNTKMTWKLPFGPLPLSSKSSPLTFHFPWFANLESVSGLVKFDFLASPCSRAVLSPPLAVLLIIMFPSFRILTISSYLAKTETFFFGGRSSLLSSRLALLPRFARLMTRSPPKLWPISFNPARPPIVLIPLSHCSWMCVVLCHCGGFQRNMSIAYTVLTFHLASSSYTFYYVQLCCLCNFSSVCFFCLPLLLFLMCSLIMKILEGLPGLPFFAFLLFLYFFDFIDLLLQMGVRMFAVLTAASKHFLDLDLRAF